VRSAAVGLTLLIALAIGGTASGLSARTNGVVSFGACCGEGDTGIFTIKPNGTGQKRIYSPPFDDANLASAWSPNGTRIAYVAPGGLWTMSATGTARRRVTAGKGSTGSPTWSSDGRRIAYTDLSRKGSSTYALYVIGANGGTPKQIVSGSLGTAAWSPTKPLILFDRARSLYTVSPSGAGLRRIGAGESGVWSPNGRRIAFDRGGSLWTMNANGSGAKKVVSVPSATAGIAWSPDSRWIAYGTGNRGDIQLVHPDGSGSTHLTHEPGLFHSQPAWQPKP